MTVLGGCATRPVNAPVGEFDPGKSHRVERPSEIAEDNATLVVLAFSGGGTRAAAFSFGVLETLRDMEGTTKSGRRVRLLDTIDVITGISGGSFTALAYGLHGEKLFDIYERSFLKRDVQGELVGRAFSPVNWPTLASTGWGRSELAANLYDEILFNGATYRDLRPDGPRIMVSATELADGTRLIFSPENFDVLCTDLSGMRLARAAAASSAVPVVLSSITIDNYGGTCGYRPPGGGSDEDAPQRAQLAFHGEHGRKPDEGDKIQERGPVGRNLAPAHRRASKLAWQSTGEFFHSEFRDRRFTPEHARRAGYGLRKGEQSGTSGRMFWGSYTGRKLKKYGHKNPMQWSGGTRRAVRMARITASATTYLTPGAFAPGGSTKGGGVKVAYPGANKLNYRNKNSTLHMADEFRKILPDEAVKLAAHYDRVLDALLNQDNTTTTKQI